MKAIRNRFETAWELLGISNEHPVRRSVSFGHSIVENYDLISQISETKINYALSICCQCRLVVGQAICVVSVLVWLSDVFDEVLLLCIPSPSGVFVPSRYS